jgi:hypothetical protein
MHAWAVKHNIRFECVKGRYPQANVGEYSITCKWTLKKQSGVWGPFSWFKVRSSIGPVRLLQWTQGFHKRRVIYWPAERLLVSQGGLCSTCALKVLAQFRHTASKLKPGAFSPVGRILHLVVVLPCNLSAEWNESVGTSLAAYIRQYVKRSWDMIVNCTSHTTQYVVCLISVDSWIVLPVLR